MIFHSITVFRQIYAALESISDIY